MKISIENFSFTCPMMGKIISERGDIKFATCAKCKHNKLGQFVDNNVYCGYAEDSESGSINKDEILGLINNLQEQLDENKAFDNKQQSDIENNSQNITIVNSNIGWERYNES